MTFYEAALRVLESEGRPLHVSEITEKSISQNLLSHVGKTPEITMVSRLAAMARRTRERRLVCTAKDTFALIELGIPEDAAALAVTGLPEENPEEALPPLRPVERHPEPRGDNVRASGRGERKRRRDEEGEERGGRRRRFPPVSEVVFEILSDSEGGLRAEEILERARSKELAGEELAPEMLLTALLEDNQRRIDAGRRPQFLFDKDSGRVSLERAGAPSEAPPLELQAAFAAALGIPLEDGRPVLPRRGGAEAPATGELVGENALNQSVIAAAKDARRELARVMRRKLQELDAGTLEKSVVKVLHHFHFRELKVAKRSKEGPLMTARKREGSVELRYAVRVLRGTQAIDRRTVQELRKDLSHYSAQVGLLLCPGEVRGDARTEAQQSGALVMLWCGDALAEKFIEAKTAVKVTQVELFEVDDQFFEVARVEADEARRRREERKQERDRRPEGEGREAPREQAAPAEEGAEAEVRPAPARAEQPRPAIPAELRPEGGAERDEEGEEGEEEGEDEHLEAASAYVQGQGGPEGAAGEGGAPGERRRRRRRRRGRRGRGGQPGAPGQPSAPGTEGQAPAAAAPAGEGVPAPMTGEAPAPAAPASEAAAPTPAPTTEAPSEAAVPSEAPAAPQSEPVPPEPSRDGEGGGS